MYYIIICIIKYMYIYIVKNTVQASIYGEYVINIKMYIKHNIYVWFYSI